MKLIRYIKSIWRRLTMSDRVLRISTVVERKLGTEIVWK
jgi:ERCC4-type nuclease